MVNLGDYGRVPNFKHTTTTINSCNLKPSPAADVISTANKRSTTSGATGGPYENFDGMVNVTRVPKRGTSLNSTNCRSRIFLSQIQMNNKKNESSPTTKSTEANSGLRFKNVATCNNNNSTTTRAEEISEEKSLPESAESNCSPPTKL